MNKRKANLRDAEIGEQEAPSTGNSPDEEHLDFETSGAGLFVNQVGGGETKNEVPEPVGGDGEGHGFGTDVEWIDLTADDPSDGAPCGGEEGDVDADESDQNLLSRDVGGRDRDANDGDQELANAHAEGADQEQPSAAEPFDTPHAWESREHVDDVDGDGDQEGVGNAGLLEEHGTIVDDEVDTGELLPGLDEDAGESTKEDFVVGGTEAVEVRRLAQLLLLLVGNTDLVELGLELRMVGREGYETREGTGCIFVALLHNEPSRRLGEKGHPDGENQSPNKLDSNRNLPRSAGGVVLGGIVDDRGDEKTDGDHPLVTGNDGATV